MFLSQSDLWVQMGRKLNYLLLCNSPTSYGGSGSYFHETDDRFMSVKFFGKQRIISARCFVILIWILSNILCLHHNSPLVWKSLLFSTFSLKIMSFSNSFQFFKLIILCVYLFFSPRRLAKTECWDRLYFRVTTESWDWETESMH